MKILFLAALIATSFARIDPKCIVELGKLGVDVVHVATDVTTANVVKGAIDVFKTIKEVKAVQTACTSAEILEYAGLTIDIGKCLQETYVVYQKATAAFNDYEQGGVTPKFIDDVDQVTLEISPLVSLCDSPAAAEHLNVLFPPACIVQLDSLAKDGLDIIEHQNNAVVVAKDLIKLAKDYNASKKICPFIH